MWDVGILSMLTLIWKGILCVLASYFLIVVTSMEQICYALRLVHVPKTLVTQIWLTYRYVGLLVEAVVQIMQAYALRAPGQKGLHWKTWPALIGQLLLRSVDRAGELYDSMLLRGYDGSLFENMEKIRFRWQDGAYLLSWIVVITLFWKVPVLIKIGAWVGGV